MYLDDILIYTEDPGQPHVEAVRWVLDQLRKYWLFANLKKCRFHQDEVRFLGNVVSAQGVRIEEERSEAAKTWPEPQSIRDIQFFLGFANFYRRCIQGFSKIAAPLTSMLKTTSWTSSSASVGRSTEADDPDGGGVIGGGGGGRIENLSKVKNITEFTVPPGRLF